MSTTTVTGVFSAKIDMIEKVALRIIIQSLGEEVWLQNGLA